MIKNIFWLKNINYDAVFFTLPSLLALFLIVPYFFLGTKAILYIFLFQSLLLGGPHFVLSIHYLMDRKKYLESLKKIFFIVLAISVSISFFFILRLQEQFSDYIFTGIFFLAGWHNYRQHYGLCKIYDAVMFKRTGDKSISKDSSYINVFYLLSTLTIFNYILVNPAGYIPIYKNWNVQIIYPSFLADIQIFMNILSIISFLFVLKKVIIDRLRQKKYFYCHKF